MPLVPTLPALFLDQQPSSLRSSSSAAPLLPSSLPLPQWRLLLLQALCRVWLVQASWWWWWWWLQCTAGQSCSRSLTTGTLEGILFRRPRLSAGASLSILRTPWPLAACIRGKSLRLRCRKEAPTHRTRLHRSCHDNLPRRRTPNAFECIGSRTCTETAALRTAAQL